MDRLSYSVKGSACYGFLPLSFETYTEDPCLTTDFAVKSNLLF